MRLALTLDINSLRSSAGRDPFGPTGVNRVNAPAHVLPARHVTGLFEGASRPFGSAHRTIPWLPDNMEDTRLPAGDLSQRPRVVSGCGESITALPRPLSPAGSSVTIIAYCCAAQATPMSLTRFHACPTRSTAPARCTVAGKTCPINIGHTLFPVIHLLAGVSRMLCSLFGSGGLARGICIGSNNP